MTDQLHPDVSGLARALNAPYDRERQLEVLLEVAVASMPEIDHAGISIAHADGRVETIAASDEMVHRLDAVQYELGEGPCLHAIEGEPVVVVQHASQDQRWPAFMARAVELGLRSQMGLRLYLDEKVRGGLNLYSTTSDVIDSETEQLAELFAAQAALALGRRRVEDDLNAALSSRTVIGVAMGILMERYGVDRDGAFAYLTRLASTSETKLRLVAEALVEAAERSGGQA